MSASNSKVMRDHTLNALIFLVTFGRVMSDKSVPDMTRYEDELANLILPPEYLRYHSSSCSGIDYVCKYGIWIGKIATQG
jgi:hypothetical protein